MLTMFNLVYMSIFASSLILSDILAFAAAFFSFLGGIFNAVLLAGLLLARTERARVIITSEKIIPLFRLSHPFSSSGHHPIHSFRLSRRLSQRNCYASNPGHQVTTHNWTVDRPQPLLFSDSCPGIGRLGLVSRTDTLAKRIQSSYLLCRFLFQTCWHFHFPKI